MNVPCYGCEKREVGCHGKCKEYAAYKESRIEFSKKKWLQTSGTRTYKPWFDQQERRKARFGR